MAVIHPRFIVGVATLAISGKKPIPAQYAHAREEGLDERLLAIGDILPARTCDMPLASPR